VDTDARFIGAGGKAVAEETALTFSSGGIPAVVAARAYRIEDEIGTGFRDEQRLRENR